MLGIQVSFIMDLVPPNRWNHVSGEQNPAESESWGLLPLELIDHELWWNGPLWLKLPSLNWQKQGQLPKTECADEQKEICLLTNVESKDPIIPVNHFSSLTKLTHVTAWVLRFIANCCACKKNRQDCIISPLTVQEIVKAEKYWLSLSQRVCFASKVQALSCKCAVPSNSALLCLHSFMDSHGILRISGREQNLKLSYSVMYPVILHSVTKLIIQTEHLRLLHAGPTLLTSSLNCRFHIIGAGKVIRSITCGCAICRRNCEKPKPQVMGQLPRTVFGAFICLVVQNI